jgi:hypothetical protein
MSIILLEDRQMDKKKEDNQEEAIPDFFKLMEENPDDWYVGEIERNGKEFPFLMTYREYKEVLRLRAEESKTK